jgi:hypothetical protein
VFQHQVPHIKRGVAGWTLDECSLSSAGSPSTRGATCISICTTEARSATDSLLPEDPTLVRRYGTARIHGQLDLGLAAECFGMPDAIVAPTKRLHALVAVGFDGYTRRSFARSVGRD